MLAFLWRFFVGTQLMGVASLNWALLCFRIPFNFVWRPEQNRDVALTVLKRVIKYGRCQEYRTGGARNIGLREGPTIRAEHYGREKCAFLAATTVTGQGQRARHGQGQGQGTAETQVAARWMVVVCSRWIFQASLKCRKAAKSGANGLEEFCNVSGSGNGWTVRVKAQVLKMSAG